MPIERRRKRRKHDEFDSNLDPRTFTRSLHNETLAPSTAEAARLSLTRRHDFIVNRSRWDSHRHSGRKWSPGGSTTPSTISKARSTRNDLSEGRIAPQSPSPTPSERLPRDVRRRVTAPRELKALFDAAPAETKTDHLKRCGSQGHHSVRSRLSSACQFLDIDGDWYVWNECESLRGKDDADVVASSSFTEGRADVVFVADQRSGS